MLLTRTYYPWRSWRGALDEMNRLRQEMDRVLGAMGGEYQAPPSAGVFPLLNVSETSDHYLVRAELPGVEPGDLNLSVMGKTLSIQGERKPLAAPAGARHHRRERTFPSFNRVIGLPSEVDPARVEAKCEDGVLLIRLPKSEAAKPRQIAISAS